MIDASTMPRNSDVHFEKQKARAYFLHRVKKSKHIHRMDLFWQIIVHKVMMIVPQTSDVVLGNFQLSFMY